MRDRSKGRELAVQALYCMAMHNTDLVDGGAIDCLDCIEMEEAGEDEHAPTQRSIQFALLIINGTHAHLDAVDTIISSHTPHWHFSRLLEVDKAILRLSIYSLLHLNDIPAAVVINEAIDLAKRYSDEHSFQFVNAVLDTFSKEHRPTQTAP